jgi:hypothetical protein
MKVAVKPDQGLMGTNNVGAVPASIKNRRPGIFELPAPGDGALAAGGDDIIRFSDP